jgi:rhomboid protease GluP
MHWHWRLRRWKRSLMSMLSDSRLPGDTVCVSRLLVWINLLWFTLMAMRGAAAGLKSSPLLTPDIRLLLDFGAQLWDPLVLHFQQWWRCLTYAYTHAGLIHLAFNMLVLYQVGPLIEREIGPARFISLYTLTALSATGLGLLWHPAVPVVGASGALFGLIGFAVAYYHRLGPTARHIRNFMFRWAVFAFIFGLLMRADNAGHLGGALGGAAFGLLLPLGVRGHRATSGLFTTLAALSVAATAASLLLQMATWFVR